ncbi:DpnD/PcfM family protein, partial [Enterococcus faecalis]|nr:DpnD/PcfM family protein [Enterococcus faecalis]
MFYKIRIIETLEKEFEIEAKNEKEALEKIQIAYDNEEIILYPEDLDHKEMKIVGYKDTFI